MSSYLLPTKHQNKFSRSALRELIQCPLKEDVSLRKARIGFLSIFFFLLARPATGAAQDSQSQSLKLGAAVELALSNYPSVRASQAQAAAAEAGIDVARVAYLPRLDTVWQQNMATRNNVFGLLFPQSVVPPISGPQLDNQSMRGAAGSAGGLLFSWEPFDFGLRRANVELARAARKQAGAGVEVTRLDVAFAAADAFLGVIANDQIARAAQANVDRMGVFAKAVQALVDNELRPGVDASRANAELAAARNQLIQAQQEAEISQASLAEAIGQAGDPVTVDAGPLLTLPSPPSFDTPNFATHPLARAQAAILETAQARESALERSYFPRFNFQSAVFGRGTGARINGSFDNSNGWYPNTGNWAVGLQSVPANPRANSGGATTTLVGDVAEISYGTMAGEYDRYNQQRMVTITANIAGQDLGSVANEVNAAIQRAGEAPRGVTVNVRGQVPPMNQTLSGLQLGLLLAVVVIFLLLVANFQSVRVALVVLSTIPAVVTGVAVALWITGTTLNVQSFMGAIMAI